MPDRLRDFARWYLTEVDAGHWPVCMPSDPLRIHGGGSELILFRDAAGHQVELVQVAPNLPIPAHSHRRFASYDLRLCGDRATMVAGRLQPSLPRATDGLRRAVPLPRGCVHGGQALTPGSFLSLQKWYEGPIGFGTDDWIGEPWL
jgi:hypothetical protein